MIDAKMMTMNNHEKDTLMMNVSDNYAMNHYDANDNHLFSKNDDLNKYRVYLMLMGVSTMKN